MPTFAPDQQSDFLNAVRVAVAKQGNVTVLLDISDDLKHPDSLECEAFNKDDTLVCRLMAKFQDGKRKDIPSQNAHRLDHVLTRSPASFYEFSLLEGNN